MLRSSAEYKYLGLVPLIRFRMRKISGTEVFNRNRNPYPAMDTRSLRDGRTSFRMNMRGKAHRLSLIIKVGEVHIVGRFLRPSESFGSRYSPTCAFLTEQAPGS